MFPINKPTENVQRAVVVVKKAIVTIYRAASLKPVYGSNKEKRDDVP